MKELPTWQQCDAACDAGVATPLETFISVNEPAGPHTNDWREGLYNAIGYAEAPTAPPGALSPTMLSNLYTMQIASNKDARQSIPAAPCVPDGATRICRAKLLMEECLETVAGLGIELLLVDGTTLTKTTPMAYAPTGDGDWEELVDGCCDLIYVATGTMAVCGAPDGAHLAEVCRANNAKFPNGIATMNPEGKYTKPPGWEAPNHYAVRDAHDIALNLIALDVVQWT